MMAGMYESLSAHGTGGAGGGAITLYLLDPLRIDGKLSPKTFVVRAR